MKIIRFGLAKKIAPLEEAKSVGDGFILKEKSLRCCRVVPVYPMLYRRAGISLLDWRARPLLRAGL